MPDTPTLVIERDDGTERARVDGIDASVTKTLIEAWRGQIRVDRSDWIASSPNIDEITDRFIIERGDGSTAFGGRFNDDTRDGNDVVVEVLSYEKDAQDAEPITGQKIYQNQADSTIADDALSNVPTLLDGTLETGDSAISLSFGQATWAKVIRDAAEPAGQDIRYNNDRTVDFLDRLGSDKPNVAISSTDQNIVNSLGVETDIQNPATHVRVLGAQQGDTRPQADAVIGNYSGGRKVWRTYSNKDIVQQSRAQKIADRFASSLNNERRRILVTAELTQSVDVDIGDRIQVTLPQHDIDRLLRVAKWTEVIGSDPVYRVELTNRFAERGGTRKNRDDLARFNDGFEGFVDRDVDAYGWQPVSSGVNATRPYPYPDDVETEVLTEVTVNSIPYRAFSQGAASGGGVGLTSDQNSEVAKVADTKDNLGTETTDTDWYRVDAWSPSVDTAAVWCYFHIRAGVDANRFDVRIDDNQGNFYPDQNGLSEFQDSNSNRTFGAIGAPGQYGDTNIVLELQMKNDSSANQFGWDANWNAWGQHQHAVLFPDHTHPVEPGLIDFPSETVSNADLIVNGNTAASNIGSGVFEETIDISGELTPGSNTIEVSSDSLGLVNILVNTELFRRGEP